MYKKRGISNSELVYVGNDIDDFKAATEANIAFIGVERESFNLPEKAPKIESLRELID